MIDKRGYIITYFKPSKGVIYYLDLKHDFKKRS